MSKRLHIILTITATISFIIACILDITSFGQDKNIAWKSIEIVRILAIIAIIFAVGLLLGLLLFSKQKYKARILLTIPIAFILFAFASILKATITYYGLVEEYNYFSAKRDINNGKIQIIETGLIMPEPNVNWNKMRDTQQNLEKKFGYKSVNPGCIVTNGIGIYNNAMEDYLEKGNGKTWRTKERQMLDSIMNHHKFK